MGGGDGGVGGGEWMWWDSIIEIPEEEGFGNVIGNYFKHSSISNESQV